MTDSAEAILENQQELSQKCRKVQHMASSESIPSWKVRSRAQDAREEAEEFLNLVREIGGKAVESSRLDPDRFGAESAEDLFTALSEIEYGEHGEETILGDDASREKQTPDTDEIAHIDVEAVQSLTEDEIPALVQLTMWVYATVAQAEDVLREVVNKADGATIDEYGEAARKAETHSDAIGEQLEQMGVKPE